MAHVLARLLTSPLNTSPIPSITTFRDALADTLAGVTGTADRALLAGFTADRVAYAFAGGYSAALERLVRGKLDEERARRASSLCITEEGGGHPRAVKTKLTDLGDGRLTVTGRKQWATAASLADVLLVAASTGVDTAGRTRLAIVAIDAGAPGVTLRRMPDPPFAPELPHAVVELDAVGVTRSDVLPGDGYEVYVKPFRTIEDAHVFLALLGYLLRCGRLHGGPRAEMERALAAAVALRGVAEMDPSAPETHVALAGALEVGRSVIDRAGEIFGGAPADVRERWERDRALSMIAERARAERRARAWERLEGSG